MCCPLLPVNLQLGLAPADFSARSPRASCTAGASPGRLMHNCRHVVCRSKCVHCVGELQLLPHANPPNIANKRVGDWRTFGLGTTSTRCGTRLPDSRRLPPRLLLRPGRQLGRWQYCKAEHPGRAQRVGARAENSMTQFNASLSAGPWVELARACPSQLYSHIQRNPTRSEAVSTAFRTPRAKRAWRRRPPTRAHRRPR